MNQPPPKYHPLHEVGHSIDRRRVLKREASAAQATGVAGWLAPSLQTMADDTADVAGSTTAPLPFFDRIGLQLYTARNQIAKDPLGTLQAVVAAGYQQAELMSIDSEAVRIAAITRDQSMMVHSVFMDFKGITNPHEDGIVEIDETIEFAQRIGLRHVVFGYIEPKVPVDAFEELGDGTIEMVEVMKLAREIGVRECHVEQDRSPAPLESIHQSYQFLVRKNA